MEIRKLRSMGGSGSAGITLPKDMLRDAGVVGPDGLDDDCYVGIQRADDEDRLEVQLIGLTD